MRFPPVVHCWRHTSGRAYTMLALFLLLVIAHNCQNFGRGCFCKMTMWCLFLNPDTHMHHPTTLEWNQLGSDVIFFSLLMCSQIQFANVLLRILTLMSIQFFSLFCPMWCWYQGKLVLQNKYFCFLFCRTGWEVLLLVYLKSLMGSSRGTEKNMLSYLLDRPLFCKRLLIPIALWYDLTLFVDWVLKTCLKV